MTTIVSTCIAISMFAATTPSVARRWQPTREQLSDLYSGEAHSPFAGRTFLGGIGATNDSPSDAMGNAVDGETKFSSTCGGVNVYPSPRAAVLI